MAWHYNCKINIKNNDNIVTKHMLLVLMILTAIIILVVLFSHNNECIIPTLAQVYLGLMKWQVNAQTVQQAGMLQGHEDQLKFCLMDQQAH